MIDRESIKASLAAKGSEELLAIYRAHDTKEWQEIVFEIIPDILAERQATVPASPLAPVSLPDGDVFARYNVMFEGIFVSNDFGFFRNGTVLLSQTSVIFEGKIKWDIRKRVLMFLAVTVLPYVLVKVALGIIPALLVLHFFCSSPGRTVISKKSIREYEQDGRQIQFMVEDAETGQFKKAVFTVDTIEHADEIAEVLNMESPNQASESTSEPAPDADSSAPQG